MKLSIVIPVLDSHKAIRRQILYWSKIDHIPYLTENDIEVIIIDDGSDPPLIDCPYLIRDGFPLLFVETKDKSKWSEHIATNIGIEKSRAKYILKTDIDHILSKEALDISIRFKGDLGRFPRSRGYLDKDGNLITDEKELKKHSDEEIKIDTHSNTFVIRKEIFDMLGGYNEYGEGFGGGGSADLMYRYKGLYLAGKVKKWVSLPALIYRWAKPKEEKLFHNLSKR